MTIIEGTLGPLENAGAPVDGTDEQQTITVSGTPTGGTFRLAFGDFETDDIAFDAAVADVQSALRALPNIGAGGCSVAGSGALPGNVHTVTFEGNLAKLAVDLLTLADNSLTGGSSPDVAIAESVAGVTATGRGASKGAKLIDTTNGVDYINTGTALEPTWTKVGTQT
jgi:hypothetical protein